MSAGHDNHRRYVFGEFVIECDRGSMSRNGAEVQLRPKSFAVLCYLVANGGRLVTKSELMEAVWGQVVVTEGSLTQCIIDVRRALGSDGRQRPKNPRS
jgi:DNA-binding winged helix-turn-helix (wHTH) protein